MANAIAKLYLRQIEDGKMTLEEVPSRLRDAVEKLLEEKQEAEGFPTRGKNHD